MKTPIYYTEKSYSRAIDKNAKFILIGNNIDGFVNFKFCEFENFEDVKTKLPNILYELRGAGEWDLNLYQVPEKYKIAIKYEYYKVPKYGKLLYTHSYMHCPIKDVQFRDKTIIFIGCDLDVEEKSIEGKMIYEQDLMIELTKLNLKSRKTLLEAP